MKKSNSSYWKIAASIVLLLSAGWIGYQSFFSLNYTDLYTANLELYPNTVYTITRGDTINSLERQAFVAYEAGDYQLALEKFNNSNNKGYFKFYKAQSHLYLDNINEAKLLLKQIIDDDKIFSAESKWYMGLIALKEKDKKAASKYLQDLTKNHTYKTEEAKVLLEKLN